MNDACFTIALKTALANSLKKSWTLIVVFVFCLKSFIGLAQTSVCISVIDEDTQAQIAFAVISTQSATLLSDVQGRGCIVIGSVKAQVHLTIAHPLYLTKVVIISSDADSSSYPIALTKRIPFIKNTKSTRESIALLSKTLTYKKLYCLTKSPEATYKIYNKVTVTPIEDSAWQHSRDNTAEKKFLFFKKPSLTKHLILLETVNDVSYYNDRHHIETISAIKSNNTDTPILTLQSSQINAVDVYRNWINIGATEYESPLSDRCLKRYIFHIEDTVILNSENHIRVKFNPIEYHFYKGVMGYMYISQKDGALTHIDLQPEYNKKVFVKFYQSYHKNKNTWLPYQSLTTVETPTLFDGIKIQAKILSQTQNINTNPKLNRYDFDETTLQLPYSAYQDNKLIAQYRSSPLDKMDSASYNWQPTKAIMRTQKLLSVGERIYFGFIPLGFVDLQTSRFFNFNKIEKTRIGLGFNTNSKFSTKNIFSTFVGYGTGDKSWKYGIGYRRLLEKKNGLYFKTQFTHDLAESGQPQFAFDQYQFPSEKLREFTLQIMDLTSTWKNEIILHPILNLDAKAGISFNYLQNQYYYQYKEQVINNIRLFEIYAGFRYAFGERNIKYLDNVNTTPSRFPILYLQALHGQDDGRYRFNYSKIDIKLEQSIRWLGIGTTKYQLMTSNTFGDAPYARLFNGKGSQQQASVLAHNSFETMRYNEFLSNRFIGLFISHNLGKLYTPYIFVQPSLILIHNMGIGTMQQPANTHILSFAYKNMNKGYLESGFFFSDLLIANLKGLKIGLGLGLAYNYGYYSSLKASDNTVFKFAVSFRM